ncbi:tetratricopeptide repeat protein [Ensifer sp. SL37]|uniref:tetratricopeptide repeat protein n=1 Tax=Ensifer sp. SL37 TaxID=2995137 RepID=UPI002275D2A2|nr:tetratricopeptide repeat protein [Ensifer sp. SL37]MCY1740784.1 tetratricopeptide repeat protein [Ensifer sp. SL37]
MFNPKRRLPALALALLTMPATSLALAESKKNVAEAAPALTYTSASAKGVSLAKGLVEKGQIAEAVKEFQKAYDAGEYDAGFYIARLLELGLGGSSDPVAALRTYQAAAEKGSPMALNRLGVMQYRGEVGQLQDFKAARASFCRAAEAQYPEALYNCGDLTEKGLGGEPDIEAAAGLYQRAAELGNVDAMNRLGELLGRDDYPSKDVARAFSYYKQSAERGNAQGLFQLALALQSGKGGETADPVMAHVYFNLASMAGYPGAASQMASAAKTLSASEVEKAQGLAREKLKAIQAQGTQGTQ